jgi:hypothetical protein
MISSRGASILFRLVTYELMIAQKRAIIIWNFSHFRGAMCSARDISDNLNRKRAQQKNGQSKASGAHMGTLTHHSRKSAKEKWQARIFCQKAFTYAVFCALTVFIMHCCCFPEQLSIFFCSLGMRLVLLYLSQSDLSQVLALSKEKSKPSAHRSSSDCRLPLHQNLTHATRGQ